MKKLFLLAYVTEHAWLLADRMFPTIRTNYANFLALRFAVCRWIWLAIDWKINWNDRPVISIWIIQNVRQWSQQIGVVTAVVGSTFTTGSTKSKICKSIHSVFSGSIRSKCVNCPDSHENWTISEWRLFRFMSTYV